MLLLILQILLVAWTTDIAWFGGATVSAAAKPLVMVSVPANVHPAWFGEINPCISGGEQCCAGLCSGPCSDCKTCNLPCTHCKTCCDATCDCNLGKYSKLRRSNVAVIIVRIVLISSFFFYCFLLNHSFPTNPNKITNCFSTYSLSIYNLHCSSCVRF